MTLATTQNRIDYTAPAANVALAVPFPVFDVAHLSLTRFSDGALLTIGTHYSVLLNVIGDFQDCTVTPTVAGAALISTGKLIIRRVVPFLQPLDIPAANRLPEKEIEKAFDLAVMRAQQLDQRQDETEALVAGALDKFTDIDDSVAAAQLAQAGAEAARDATLAAYDSFDDRYLGAKSSDPVADNDGNALAAGSLYFNVSLPGMKLYTGSTWVVAYISGGDVLAKSSNLSDLPSKPTARTNLGLGTAAQLDVGTGSGQVAAGDRGVPAGALMPYAGSSAPSGWLLAAGQAVSRTGANAALFAAIGTTHGVGDGSTTFNLPDLRGRAAFGVDNMNASAANRVTNAGSGIVGSTLGANGGAENHTLTIAQMPAHNHDPIQSGSGNGTTTVYTAFATTPFGVSATSNSNLTTQGGGLPHNNMPPALMLNYIIKL